MEKEVLARLSEKFQKTSEELTKFFDILQKWETVHSTEFSKLYDAKSATEAVILVSQEKLLALQKAKRDMDMANQRIMI